MSKVVEVAEDAFEEAVGASEIPVVVDFYATWCAPCRQVAPMIDSLAEEMEGRALFVKVDVEKCADLASRYSVSSLPTVLVLEGGKVVHRMPGVTSRRALKDNLESLLG